MKKCILLLLVITFVLVAFSACGGDNPVRDYVIVYNSQSSSDARVKKALVERFDDIGVKAEFSNSKSASFDKEIVLGEADFRPEAKAALEALKENASEHIGAYSISYDGSKVVIAATSPEAEAVAVDEFMSTIVKKQLTLTAGYSSTVYFDIPEYKKSGEVLKYGNTITGVLDVAEIKLSSDTYVALVNGTTDYYLPRDMALPLPTADEVAVTLYHPEMSYTISYSSRTLVITVSSVDGSASRDYRITFTSDTDFTASAEIVNKDGAKGVLTLTSDDGDQRTADFFYTKVAPKYDCFKISIAMPTREIANLVTTRDGKAWLKDDNGNYVLELFDNFYSSKITDSVFVNTSAFATKADFWKEIISTGQIEVLSHSHTHSAWGQTDDVIYDSGGNLKYPAGNVIKELHASAQIISNILGLEASFICRPGGHADMTSDYFFALVESDDTFLGMRTSNGAPPLVGESSTKLNAPENFITQYGRMRIATILAKGNEAALTEDGTAFAMADGERVYKVIEAGISAWTRYIELAMEHGQWASIGFHEVLADDATKYASGYAVFDSQVMMLMDYVQPLVESGDLWLASFTEASKYYFEWSTAEVATTVCDADRIDITLTDKEEDPRFDMPLTVKVTVPGHWNQAELDSYGVKTLVDVHVAEDGTRFVYANIVPGDAVSTLTAVQ